MHKYLITIFTLIICISAVIVFIFKSEETYYPAGHIFKALPKESPLFIQLNNINLLDADQLHEYPILSGFQQKTNNSIIKSIECINALIKNSLKFNALVRNTKLILSVNIKGKSNIAALYLLRMQNNYEKKIIRNAFKELPHIATPFSERMYNKTKIITFTFNNLSLHYTFCKGIFLLSEHSFLLEESIRQLNLQETIYDNVHFQKAYKSANANADMHIFINHAYFPLLASTIVHPSYKALVKNCTDYGNWSELDLEIRKNEVLLSGFTLANDTHYLSLYAEQQPVKAKIVAYAPVNSAMVTIHTFSDIALFLDKQRAYLKRNNLLYQQAYDLKKIQTEIKLDFLQLIKDIQPTEIAQVNLKVDKTFTTNFIMLNQSSSQAENELLQMLKIYTTNKEINIEDFQTQYPIDKEKIFTIYKNPYPHFPELIFGKIYASATAKYFSRWGNALIFAPTVDALKAHLHQLVLNETLSTDINFQHFMGNLDAKFNLFFYLNISKALPLAPVLLDNPLQTDIEKEKSHINKFYALSWQMIEENQSFYNNIYLHFNPAIKENTATVWQHKLDAPLAFKPCIVTNHKDKDNKEIIFQDTNNNLYLMNKEGRLLWKIKIADQLLSSIYQIDYYKNGKLQYLFNTKEKIYLIDRNGNNVDRFPIVLRSPATNGMAVFDYDTKRNYRYFVACKNLKVYAYNREGNLVTGWKFGKTESEVKNPIQHFKVNNKDYIVFSDKMKTYILNRRGYTRIPSDVRFEHSHNPLFLDAMNVSPRIMATDVRGEIHAFYLNGKHTTHKVQSFSANHFFTVFDIDANGKNDYIFADKTMLYAFHSQGKLLFKKKFNSSIIYPLNTYVFSSTNRSIGLVLEEGKIVLINKDGAMHKNFPMKGNSPFSIGLVDASNAFHLFVGSKDGSMYNYPVKR
jgi:3-methyladenine DNA glycosylase Tag